ncbi:hypothetical protein Q4589_01590 [Cobetia marina]|uniref:hypothetical protein n=1 Tax=Cobetia marina TaxID=28258 RepID=UPI0026E253C2|nr:hypothetical protein [Cobetia marina]MDO6786277.1 hypothetical protein [Cobetia marina]
MTPIFEKDIRYFTRHEQEYVAPIRRRKLYTAWSLALVGILLVGLSCVFLMAPLLFPEKDSLPWPADLVVIVIVWVGLFLMSLPYHARHGMPPTAGRMTGQLEEVTSSTPTTPPDSIIEDRFQRQGWKQTHEGISYHSSNPRKITTRHYYLGNTRLILPPGADAIVRPALGEEISVIGAHVPDGVSPPFRTLFPFLRLARQGSPDHGYMVVLQYDDKINIDGVLEKYGKHFFWRRRMRKPLLALVMVLLLMLPFLSSLIIALIDHFSEGLGPGLTYPWWAACLCLVLSFPVIYLKTRKALIGKSDRIDYQEQLKG